MQAASSDPAISAGTSEKAPLIRQPTGFGAALATKFPAFKQTTATTSSRYLELDSDCDTHLPPAKRPKLNSDTSSSASTSEQRSTLFLQGSSEGIEEEEEEEEEQNSPRTPVVVHQMFGGPPPQRESDDSEESEEESEEDELADDDDSPMPDENIGSQENASGIVPSTPAAKPATTTTTTPLNTQMSRSAPTIQPKDTGGKPKMSISNLMASPIPQGSKTISTSHTSGPYVTTSQPRPTLQRITLYLEDSRPEEHDFQIADVILPLLPGPAGSGICFANSQDLVNQLQSGPARVDGPAKLFCLRKEAGTDKIWRQCILRMSDGEVVASSGNIQVSPSLEVKIVIEKYQSTRSEHAASMSPSSTQSLSPAIRARTPISHLNLPARADGKVAIPPTPVALRPVIKPTTLIPGLDKIRSSNNKLPHPNEHWPQPKGEGSGPSQAKKKEKEEHQESKAMRLRKATADYVRPLIQKDPFWPKFHDTKGHVKSNAEAVKSLEFFESLVDKYVGQVVPADVEVAGGKRITKASLLEAVGRGTTWGSDCHIVLGLVKRFGPGAPEENQEVVELLKKAPGDKKGGIADFVSRMKKIRDEHDEKESVGTKAKEKEKS